jgi:molybdopterin-containing oxidoreductase family membrane subunit
MWLERFVIIVSSLAHSFDPAEWIGVYRPTWVEAAITSGSFAWFFLFFLLFVKNFPAISITEVKEMSTHGGTASASH